MKIPTRKTLLISLAICLVFPSLAFASWWNPLSWLGNKPDQTIQPIATKFSHQDPVILQPSIPSVVIAKPATKVIAPTTNPSIAITDSNEHIKSIVMELIQQYLSPEELERIKSVVNHTTATYDPDKAGLQLAYIPGSMVADDGTYFSATNLSSSNLNTDSATINSATIGSLSLEGDANFSSTNTGTLEVGSGSQSTGITIYDTATHEPFCITSENGILKSDAGKCAN